MPEMAIWGSFANPSVLNRHCASCKTSDLRSNSRSCPTRSMIGNLKVLLSWTAARSSTVLATRVISRAQRVHVRHLKRLLDKSDAKEFVVAPCNLLAQGKVPEEIRAALKGARLTPLLKLSGGARGIATGCTVPRCVARTLTKQFVEEFEAECAPFSIRLVNKSKHRRVGHNGALASRARRVVATALLSGEQLCAFLDDVYVLCDPRCMSLKHPAGNNHSLEPSRGPTRGHRRASWC